MSKEEYNIVEAMRRYGGGFVQSLAACFMRADSDSFDKLKAAFPEYWSQYAEFAERAFTTKKSATKKNE